MNPTQTVRNQYLTFDHPFEWSWILVITIVCGLVMLAALYREQQVLGNRTTILFATLRLLAIGAVLWMMLSPTNVLQESTTTRRSVAVLMDISASMATVDPPGAADDVRWMAALDSGRSPNASVAVADRAVAALGVAQQQLILANRAVQRLAAQHVVAEPIELASRAVVRCRAHLVQLREQSLPGPTLGDENNAVESSRKRLSALLESPEFDALADWADRFGRGGTPDEPGWREAIPDLISRVVVAKHVFEQLAATLSATGRDEIAEPDRDKQKRFEGRSRSGRLALFLDSLQSGLSESIRQTADVHFVAFDQAAVDIAGPKEATRVLTELPDRNHAIKRTDLGSALRHVRQLRQRQPVAAAFVLSDVAHNHTVLGEPTELATQLEGTPIYMVPIGNPSRLRDIDLVSVSAPAVAMRNDDVVIEAHLGIYQCLGERCTVELLRDGEVIDFRQIPVETDSEIRSVRFDQRVSEVGRAHFQLAVQPIDGEMTSENNFDEIEINVTRNDIKVLLADELPRWEYRYLAQLFRRDAKVELDELLFNPRLIATGRREASGTLPVSVDQWDQYDVVIVGDLPAERFSVASQESLIEYVRSRGGTVILIAGDRALPAGYIDYPLGDIVPVRPVESVDDDVPQEYAFRVTETGRSHVALMIGETERTTRDAWDFVNQFSPLHHLSTWRTPLPTARSLIAAVPRGVGVKEQQAAMRDSSFLCWQPVGRGRVVYLSAPDTYRLRFLRGDQLHYRFWGQLMRWAIASDLSAGNHLARIRTNKTLYETDSTVRVEVELLNERGEAIVEDLLSQDSLHLKLTTGESTHRIPLTADAERPGIYTAGIESLEPGVYQVRPAGRIVDELVGEATADDEVSNPDAVVAGFTIQADLPPELVDTRSDRALAGQIAEVSGGQRLPPTAVEEILQLTDLEPIVSHRIAREPLWTRWRYLWLVFGCLQTEWIIRKWRGLS